ncbi:MAG: N,N'-diacetylchitobiose phosphorylase [Clostridiales bacterium]|nr:N,N'-diacetylchitobiose phosphorylase [Clostridiales bacterium]
MKYGYFDDVSREYVISGVDVPQSMTNYLGTQRMGAVISHNAGGYCWLDSPQHHRITRFRPNGVPMDWPGHYAYLRDDTSGDFWSLSWQPVGLPRDQAEYEARHGLSYSVFSCLHDGIRASQTLFIPREEDLSVDPVEIFDIRIRNESSRERQLSVVGYVEFSFHEIDMDNQNFQMSLYAAGSHYESGAVLCELHYEPDAWQFFASDAEPDGFEGVREAFIGAYHTERDPQALISGKMSGSLELGGNPCGALRRKLVLRPGEEKRVLFYLGTGRGKAAEEARRRYDFAGTDRAFAALRKFWDEKLGALQVRTPHENMNRSLNIWNLYQSEVNVLFSRFSSFIEVGGRTGLGYRDTAQDAMCIPHAEPAMCEKRIRQLLHGQMREGYGLHLFDPAVLEKKEDDGMKSPTVIPEGNRKSMLHGIADACADDALWLIPAIIENVRESGNTAFFEEIIPFADQDSASVWDHMKASLDFSYRQVGKNGVTKGLRADWNDCLNLGGGESAMVAFLLIWATNHFLDAAAALGRQEDLARYTALRDGMAQICRERLWDGRWFLRGLTADGSPIGSHRAREGKVHLESNTWAVISGAATPQQGRSCMDAVDEWLYTPYGLMLNAPSFVTLDDSVGFVTRVYPGVKENGAIFSHPNPWAWVAECLLGRGGRAMKFYDALLPENQNDRMEIRQAEPYSYCQFIMGRDHTAFGRARHPFMTGSSGWAYYAATRYMLGIRPGFRELVIDPCIPAEWDGFEVTRRWRGALYRIRVSNPSHVEKGIRRLRLDGQDADTIPAFTEGEHWVEAEMG